MENFRNIEDVLSDGTTEVYSLGVTSEQHEIVKKILEGGFSRRFGNYTLEEVDSDMVQTWIDNAKDDPEPDQEYIDYLETALKNGGDVYALEDWVGDFHQTIGEVIVYY
jgi:hypothetical protein